MNRIKCFCGSVNHKKLLFLKWNLHSNTLEKFLLHYTGWNPSVGESIRQILFCEINLSKWKHVDTLQRRITKWFPSAKILILPFIYRLKSLWRSVNSKNFLPWNRPVKIKPINHYIRTQFFSVEIWIIKRFFLIYRMKSSCRGFNMKNFLPKNI